jgi:hypothetical protein
MYSVIAACDPFIISVVMIVNADTWVLLHNSVNVLKLSWPTLNSELRALVFPFCFNE